MYALIGAVLIAAGKVVEIVLEQGGKGEQR